MIHAPEKDKKMAMGKFSFIELNYVGQAFRFVFPLLWFLFLQPSALASL